MFYPDHYIRDYCLYLGSLETFDGHKYDLGVYETKDDPTMVSHAIVFGDDDADYMSGLLKLDIPGAVYQLNHKLYTRYLMQQAKEAK